MRQRMMAWAIAASLTMLGSISTLPEGMAVESSGVLGMLERACSNADGHFEEFHTFQLSGIAWSGGASCTTANTRLTCREGHCKAISLDRRQVTMIKHKASPDLGQAVPLEHLEFERVLRGAAVY